jgi:hypothetical protein
LDKKVPLKKLLLVLLLSLERLLDEQKLVMRRFLASIKKVISTSPEELVDMLIKELEYELSE